MTEAALAYLRVPDPNDGLVSEGVNEQESNGTVLRVITVVVPSGPFRVACTLGNAIAHRLLGIVLARLLIDLNEFIEVHQDGDELRVLQQPISLGVIMPSSGGQWHITFYPNRGGANPVLTFANLLQVMTQFYVVLYNEDVDHLIYNFQIINEAGINLGSGEFKEGQVTDFFHRRFPLRGGN
ncbi:MAG: hypothetical protein M1828_003512 [Chrysothrix sp. TS-e1954]|nr:MAG: hypothetical protein M1828_003512 [Chrysothrix sp. TS-e1954]